jgi:hypothetical protein
MKDFPFESLVKLYLDYIESFALNYCPSCTAELEYKFSEHNRGILGILKSCSGCAFEEYFYYTQGQINLHAMYFARVCFYGKRQKGITLLDAHK